MGWCTGKGKRRTVLGVTGFWAGLLSLEGEAGVIRVILKKWRRITRYFLIPDT